MPISKFFRRFFTLNLSDWLDLFSYRCFTDKIEGEKILEGVIDCNFAVLVHDFLHDRQAIAAREALGNLFLYPDFGSKYQNAIRLSALLSCKSFAFDWLELRKTRVGQEGIAYESKYQWERGIVDLEFLKRCNNLWKTNLWQAAKDFRAGKKVADEAKIFFELTEKNPWRYSERRMIWSGTRIIEGNARIHALVLKVLDEGIMPDVEILYWKKGKKKGATELLVGR
jgi:hypothetical protein